MCAPLLTHIFFVRSSVGAKLRQDNTAVISIFFCILCAFVMNFNIPKWVCIIFLVLSVVTFLYAVSLAFCGQKYSVHAFTFIRYLSLNDSEISDSEMAKRYFR